MVEYGKKFGFKATTPDRPNRIFMKGLPPSPAPEQDWEARIDPPGLFNSVKKTVKYRKHGTTSPPAVARWRWLRMDEGTWTRCVYGCCEISYW